MKKIMYLIPLFIIIQTNFVFSQIEFKINEIRISEIVIITDSIYVEDMDNGARIDVACEIVNKTDSQIILSLYECEISVLFNYKNAKYEFSIGSFIDRYSWYDNKWGNKDSSIVILPNNNYELFFTTSYLSGTDFFKTKRLPIIDCTREVIETLPTLKVKYKDKNIEIITNEIKNVIIDNFIYNLDEVFGRNQRK